VRLPFHGAAATAFFSFAEVPDDLRSWEMFLPSGWPDSLTTPAAAAAILLLKSALRRAQQLYMRPPRHHYTHPQCQLTFCLLSPKIFRSPKTDLVTMVTCVFFFFSDELRRVVYIFLEETTE
jgi:hypothetical protein